MQVHMFLIMMLNGSKIVIKTDPNNSFMSLLRLIKGNSQVYIPAPVVNDTAVNK